MNNADKATPRPWKVAGKVYISGPKGGSIARTIMVAASSVQQDCTNEMICQANAELIVKAVNSHDYLLYALREYVAEWEQTHAHEDSKTGITQEPCSLMLAKHALAKAEGKGEG